MALPSSRRPVYAQQLLDEESKQIQKSVLKIKISKSQTVLAQIASWYTCLNEKTKKNLTPKQLKRRILKFCYDLDFDYNKLPDNWLDSLKENHGLVLHEKEKKAPKTPKKKFPAYVMDDLENEDEDDVDGMWGGSKQSFQDELRELMSGSKSEFTITGVTSGTINESTAGDSFRETRATFRKRHSNSTVSHMNDKEFTHSTPKEKVAVNEKKSKRFLDLTNEPPPLEWLASLAKGVALPRIQRLYSDKDVNVLFYDYEPTPAEFPPGTIVKSIRDVGFQWWHNEIKAALQQAKGGSQKTESSDSES